MEKFFQFGKPFYMTHLTIWESSDWFSGESCNPIDDEYVFHLSEDDVKSYIDKYTYDNDISEYRTIEVYEKTFNNYQELFDFCMRDYYDLVDAGIYNMSKTEIKDECIECMTDLVYNKLNVDNDLKQCVIDSFIEHVEPEHWDCKNFDFDQSLEGKILVIWSWDKYIGYARECHEIKVGTASDTMEMCVPVNMVFKRQCSVVGSITDSFFEVYDNLMNGTWKWRNPITVEHELENIF